MGKVFARNPALISPSELTQSWVTHSAKTVDTPESTQKRGFIHSFIQLTTTLMCSSPGLGTGLGAVYWEMNETGDSLEGETDDKQDTNKYPGNFKFY